MWDMSMRDSQGHLRAGEVLKDEEETQPSFQGVEVDLHSQGEPFSGYFNVRLTSVLVSFGLRSPCVGTPRRS